MTYEDFIRVFQPNVVPWEHDFYTMTMSADMDTQAFFDAIKAAIPELDAIWFHIWGGKAYVALKKGTVVPELDWTEVTVVTDVPTESETP